MPWATPCAAHIIDIDIKDILARTQVFDHVRVPREALLDAFSQVWASSHAYGIRRLLNAAGVIRGAVVSCNKQQRQMTERLTWTGKHAQR